MIFQIVVPQECRTDILIELWGVEYICAFNETKLLYDFWRTDIEADSHPGAENFRKRVDTDHIALILIQRIDGREVFASVPQLPVGTVLDQRNPVFLTHG